MGAIGWDEIGKGSSTPTSGEKQEGGLFVSTPPGKHQIRLVGKVHRVKIAWIPNDETKRNERFVVPNREGDTYIQRLNALKIKVNDTYSSNCFLRADTEMGETRLRILEKGISIFKHFKNYYDNIEDDEGNKIDPGGPNGPDWKIICNQKDGGGKRNVEYDVMALKQTPFSKKEIDLIVNMTKKFRENPEDEEIKKLPLGKRGIIDLEKFYDLDKAAEKLDKRLAELAGIDVGNAESVEVEDSSDNKKSDNTDSIDNIVESGDGDSDNDNEQGLEDMLDSVF